MILSLQDCVKRYGPIFAGHWEGEEVWCRSISIPSEFGSNWINTLTGTPVARIYCNRDMADPLLSALQNIRDRGFLDQLKTFDGCFNVRDVRGEPGKPSVHCYALAIDINAATNPLGSSGDISEGLAKCFTDEGFSWGANFHRKDPQHFSYAWE